MQVVETHVPVPKELELLTLKIVQRGRGRKVYYVSGAITLLQGTTLFDFLPVNLESVMTPNECEKVIIIGDLTQNTVRDVFHTL